MSFLMPSLTDVQVTVPVERVHLLKYKDFAAVKCGIIKMHEIVSLSQVEQLESQNRQVRKDFKEMKIREARTMSDYSELEEENVVLQKQLAGLRQAQVRYIKTTDISE